MIWTIVTFVTLFVVAGVSTLVGIAIGRAIGPGDWPKGPLVRRPLGAGSEPEMVDGRLDDWRPGESYPDMVERRWREATQDWHSDVHIGEDGAIEVRDGRLWPSTPASEFAPPENRGDFAAPKPMWLPERAGPPTPRVEIERPTEIERATEQLVRRRMAEQEARRAAVEVHAIGDDEHR